MEPNSEKSLKDGKQEVSHSLVKSEREERIRKITNLYYSNPEVQKALFSFSANREICPRYFEGFGKRPDSFQYPADVFELVKKGATSFHCSEELWSQPLNLSTGMNPKDINELRTGWDLCLPDFETIFVEINGEIKKITLKELSSLLGFGKIGRFSVNKDIKVISINSEYNIEKDRIKDLIIREKKSFEKLLRITAEDGRQIYVSEDHPILIFTNDGIIQKTANLTSSRDFLLMPLKLAVSNKNKKELNLSNLLKKSKNHKCIIEQETIRYKGSNLKIPVKLSLNYNFGKLIGYYLSEGSIDKHRLEFTFNKSETKEARDVLSLFNSIFQFKNKGKNTIVPNKKANSLKVRINSTLLTFIFKECLGFGFGAQKKKIPDWVYNCSEDFISGILTGYLIGDGSCIYDGYKKESLRITAASASRELITGLSVLCLILGIDCNILRDYRPKFNIIKISGEDGIKSLIHYCKEFFEKKNCLFTPKRINHPSKHRVFPPFFDKEKIRHLKDRNKQINLYRAIRLNMCVNKEMALLAANSFMEKVIKNNLFPIRIKKIEQIDYRGYFYDLETVKNHNFLQGDGLFTHNCIDIDSKYLDYSKISAELIIKILKFHGIKNIGIKFSGSKGFHIIIPWNSFPKKIQEAKTSDMFPEWPRIIIQYINEQVKEQLIEKISGLERPNKYIKDFHVSEQVIPDLVLISPRHLFRMPYSLHEKTALASIVISPEEIPDFQPKQADPFKVKIKNFLPNSKENEAKELLMQALDWYKGKIVKEEKTEEKFKPLVIRISDSILPPSIKKILEGIKDGKKRALFILINFFRSIGMEKDELEKRIYDWNKKNAEPLPEGYIQTQLSWSYRKKIAMPPSYDKDYYKGIGIIPTEEEMRNKNPVNYIARKSYGKDNRTNFKNKG